MSIFITSEEANSNFKYKILQVGGGGEEKEPLARTNMRGNAIKLLGIV